MNNCKRNDLEVGQYYNSTSATKHINFNVIKDLSENEKEVSLDTGKTRTLLNLLSASRNATQGKFHI